MILGYILEPGEALQAADQPLFKTTGDDPALVKSVFLPLKSSDQRVGIGSSGGVVTDQHHLFFRPWVKLEGPNPELDEANQRINSYMNQLSAMEKDIAQVKVGLAVAVAQRDEARRWLGRMPVTSIDANWTKDGPQGTVSHQDPTGEVAPPQP